MSVEQTLRITHIQGSRTLTTDVTIESGSEVNLSLTGDAALAANTADQLVDLAFDKDRLKLVYIASDQNITLETNSSSAPDTTLTITADKPLIWYDGCGLANPFAAADVTKAYITTSVAGTAPEIDIRTVVDPTA